MYILKGCFSRHVNWVNVRVLDWYVSGHDGLRGRLLSDLCKKELSEDEILYPATCFHLKSFMTKFIYDIFF